MVEELLAKDVIEATAALDRLRSRYGPAFLLSFLEAAAEQVRERQERERRRQEARNRSQKRVMNRMRVRGKRVGIL